MSSVLVLQDSIHRQRQIWFCVMYSCGRLQILWTRAHTQTHIRVNNYSTSSYQQLPSVSHLHPFWSNIIEIPRVLPVSIIVRLSAADLVWPISCSHHRAQIGVAECKQPIQTTNFRTRDFPRVHPPPPPPRFGLKLLFPFSYPQWNLHCVILG